MNPLNINRPCEVTENEDLKMTFTAFLYREYLINDINKLNKEINSIDIDEEHFKNKYFDNNFAWNQFISSAIIIGGTILIGGYFIFSIFIACTLSIASIICFYYYGKNNFWKKNKNILVDFENKKIDLKAKMDELNKNKNEIKNEVNKVNDYIKKLNLIPSKYHDYWTTLLGYFNDCRADTLKEAINLLEHELYMQRQTQLLEQHNYELQRMRVELGEAIQNVEASVNDVNSSVNFNTLVNAIGFSSLERKIEK